MCSSDLMLTLIYVSVSAVFSHVSIVPTFLPTAVSVRPVTGLSMTRDIWKVLSIDRPAVCLSTDTPQQVMCLHRRTGYRSM